MGGYISIRITLYVYRAILHACLGGYIRILPVRGGTRVAAKGMACWRARGRSGTRSQRHTARNASQETLAKTPRRVKRADRKNSSNSTPREARRKEDYLTRPHARRKSSRTALPRKASKERLPKTPPRAKRTERKTS